VLAGAAGSGIIGPHATRTGAGKVIA